MIILVSKEGVITQKNIKSYNTLYMICNYRNDTNFELLNSWNNEYYLYGKKIGRSGYENTYVFPNNNTQYYGTLCITKKKNDEYIPLTLNEWTNFYTNYGFNHGINANNGFVESERPGQQNRQDFKFKNKNSSHLVKLGMDYYINDKNTLSAYTNQSFTSGSGTGLTTVMYDALTNRNTSQLSGSSSSNSNQTYDVVFKHDFDKKDENLESTLNIESRKLLKNNFDCK